MLSSYIDGQLDAVNGRRKAGDKKTALSVRKHFIELPSDATLAGRVAFALYVGRVLQQRQYALFSVLGKCVQIEKAVVGRCGIDFEVACMQHHPERRVDSQGDA